LYGCRQFVLWDVEFSFITNATLEFNVLILLFLIILILNSFNLVLLIKLYWFEAEVKSLWSLYVGLHTSYKGKNKKLLKRKLELILKNYLSSDYFLKLESMKLKSLVIVNYYVTVNAMSNFAHTAHHARKVFVTGKWY